MKEISISATIQVSIEKLWELWTSPEHITRWNFASDDWHCPEAENDLRPGGKFRSTMASRDGKMSFDFEGVYDEVVNCQRIAYSMGDGRKAQVDFLETDEGIKVTTVFNPEDTNSQEMQRAGWQAILDNFKKYALSQS